MSAETVTQIAHWRYNEGLGYGTIADRLPESRKPPVNGTDGLRVDAVRTPDGIPQGWEQV